jgi:arabinan endo-1,5-alpha-L-arabinosidase
MNKANIYRQILATAIIALMAILPCHSQKRYTNPVFKADFPDPSVQRGTDGYFYAYATGPNCLRSKDLVTWESVSKVIDRPTWNDTTYVDSEGKKKTDYYSFWACDVSRVEDKYVMYYACALWGNGSRTGIGVAAGNTLTKFDDKGKMFRSTEIKVENSIDPVYWEDKDKKYLAWGSWNGIYISELAEDGLKLKDPSKKTMIAGTAFEGAMIHKRGNLYYLFCSVGSCCDGLNSTYHCVVGRSTKLLGPYLSKTGGKMLDNNYTTVLRANSRWIAPGHNSEIITDDNGDDWLLYHAIDKKAPDDGRMMLLDKITWSDDGWPTINNNTPSTTQQAAPVFYEGDGANLNYLFRNMDMSKSSFKYWDITKSEDCNLISGVGTNHYSVGCAKDSGTFDISQTATGIKNGLYEIKTNAFDSEYNVSAYINLTEEPIHNASQPEELPTTHTTACTQFNQGKFARSFYGLVADGTLKIGIRTTSPLTAGETFYIGKTQVIYREKNPAALTSVLNSYYLMAEATFARPEKFHIGYRTAIETYRNTAESTTDNDTRYNQLLAIHNTLDSINISRELYDTLQKKLEWMQAEITKAEQGNYCNSETKDLYEKILGAYNQCTADNGSISLYLDKMEETIHNIRYNYQRGDGTAENPYIISRPEQMMQMHKVLVKEKMIYFAMDADVDMKGYTWEQLNTADNNYRHWINFDGRGHIIRNLTPSSDEGYPSFFGILCGECRNVGFVDARIISSASGAGILSGYMGHNTFSDEDGNKYPVIVENCYFTGSIEARGYVGTVGGTLNASPITIRNVYTAVDITGTGTNRNYYYGGIVGRVCTHLTIENSYSTGSVTGSKAAPIAAGGQTATTPASKYVNVIAWNNSINGTNSKSDLSSFAITEEEDTLINTYSYARMKLDGTEITDGKSHEELQSIASGWGGAWHSDATAGNGYPILKWQFERGDYSEICGHSTTNAIQGIETPDSKANGIYDLKGRKVTTPTRGIYIIDGKKRIYR